MESSNNKKFYIIKASYHDKIKKFALTNEDISFSDFLLMLQRVFRNAFQANDQITLLWQDDEDDFITIDCDSDLSFAISEGQVTRFRIEDAKPYSIAPSPIAFIAKELKPIQDALQTFVDKVETSVPSVAKRQDVFNGEPLKKSLDNIAFSQSLRHDQPIRQEQQSQPQYPPYDPRQGISSNPPHPPNPSPLRAPGNMPSYPRPTSVPMLPDASVMTSPQAQHQHQLPQNPQISNLDNPLLHKPEHYSVPNYQPQESSYMQQNSYPQHPSMARPMMVKPRPIFNQPPNYNPRPAPQQFPPGYSFDAPPTTLPYHPNPAQ